MIGRVASPRFIGRRAELDALRTAVDRAADGVGSVVLVGGEPGIGKSRLVAKLCAQARRDGVTVVMGECLPLGDGELPYAPIVSVLRSLARDLGIEGLAAVAGSGHDELTRLAPDLRPADQPGHPNAPGIRTGDGSQARLFEQLLAVFVAVARRKSLLVVVEDVHWSDQATRDFLSFLVRAARAEPIAIVITYRSDDVARTNGPLAFVHELERSGQALRVALTALNRQEVRDLVAAIREQDPDPLLIDRLHARAEGNPFFTEELLASADAPDAPLPESLAQALLLRLAGCPADVAAVIRTVAVAGREMEHGMLEAAVALPPDRLIAALRDAVERNVLVHAPGGMKYAFRHALLGEAAYSDLLPVERERLHRALAGVLTRRPELGQSAADTAARLSHHWYAAGDKRLALPASIDAAVAAERLHAPGEALVHYERALEIWDAVAPGAGEVPLDRLELLSRASEAASMLSEGERAVRLAEELLQRTDRADAVATAIAHARLGHRLWAAGRGVDAIPELRRAVQLIPEPPTAERAQVLAAEAHMLMLCHRLAESELRCDEALTLAREVGARHVEANLLNTMCANLSHAGQPTRGAEAAAQARAIARELGLIDELARGYVNGSDALDHAGLIDESIALATEGVEVCCAHGADRLFGNCLRGEIVGRLLRTGDWDRVAELLDDLFRRPLSGIAAGNAYGHRALLHAQRGDREEAWDAVIRGDQYVRRSGGSMWLAPIAEARATIELWDERPHDAARTVDAYLGDIGGDESLLSTARLYELGVRAAADVALRDVGDPCSAESARARVAALLGRVDELAVRLSGPLPPRVHASHHAAAAEATRIDTANPVAWETAARLWEKAGDPYQTAYAHWRHAEALLIIGRERLSAQRKAREAHAIASAIGALPLVEAIGALARRGRLDLGTAPTLDETNAALNRLELTPREVEVFALVGEGMTNRQIGNTLFIAEKTASVHVSRILGKLSVPNRAAAAAAAQRLGVQRRLSVAAA